VARPKTTRADDALRLAIVGGGPMCTYALERLAAQLGNIELRRGLRISIFERNGRFGAGAIHSDQQAPTSYMNRVASQITFAADETNRDACQLLPASQRPSFIEWCERKYRETGDPKYQLHPKDVPRRYLHGRALKDAFDRYHALLRGIGGVTVNLYAAEVTDVCETESSDEPPYRLHIGGAQDFVVLADRILFVTGVAHSRQRDAVYPLEQRLTLSSVPPRSTVAVAGLGLTAVDIVLHLTEGRGGTFTSFIPTDSPNTTKLRYRPSGSEPAQIIGVSQSGLLKMCRPDNVKASDPTARAHSSLEHRPAFLTSPALCAIQLAVGISNRLPNGAEVLQLDFELHLFPLIVLEMAFVYYKTLLGNAFADEIQRVADDRYKDFLAAGGVTRDARIEHLLEPVQRLFDEAAAHIERPLQSARTGDGSRFADMRVRDAFYMTVFGSTQRRKSSPWGHSTAIRDHRFQWRRLFDPVTADDLADGRRWQDLIVAFMDQDHLNAAQGNLRNPVKAACDGVWRDLRSVLAEVIDRGGLTPDSHRRFMSIYLRYYERMSNGTGLEPMSKVLALIEAGILDVSLGPSPTIVQTGSSVELIGTVTDVALHADSILHGRVDQFDADADVDAPLYPNLLRRKLVKRWRNATASSSFAPGAIDLDADFHPVRSDGSVNSDFTFLGGPSEGLCFFQLSAARPRADSYILNSVARWSGEIVGVLSTAQVVCEQ
jgi:hypothetical protein